MQNGLKFLVFVFAFLLLNGCSGLLSEKEGVLPPEPSRANMENYPYVFIKLNTTEGPAPFWVHYTYWCSDPDHDLVSCEMKLDGRTLATGKGEDLFDDFTYPGFYAKAISTVGEHELTIVGTDREGHVSNYSASFAVLKGASLSQAGWHTCNGVDNEPCDSYQKAYCNRFTPTEISVREAAAEAIAAHPGRYSANQVLDIYDWVHKNVFYQNVPVNLTYQPYSPAETVSTGSGDCKNHAVLIASMIEAIGGTARVVLAPGCQHAYAEVYIGGNSSTERFSNAVFAHYGSKAPRISWHTHDTGNSTEVWMPIDTAGGAYPGQTIETCWNVSQSFVMYDCETNGQPRSGPDLEWIEYGPFSLYNGNLVIEPGYWKYFTYSVDTKNYDYCTYSITLKSKARLFDWFIIPAYEYENFKNDFSYNYYYQEKQVSGAEYNFTLSKPEEFNIIVWDSDRNNAITIETGIESRCYRK